MFKDLAKKVLRFSLFFVLWVFILAFNWSGRTLFDRAHEVLIENALVEYVDQQIADTWDKVVVTAGQTYQNMWSSDDTDKKNEE
jgi:hypothetical protein